jgi:3-hydroxyacyl-[acyl-carrier-protein] dehydratase
MDQTPLLSLPHGPEFRFLHELTSLVPGKSAAARYRLTGAETFLAGHFPGQPIMPGVLMIEAVAQLAGVAAQCDPDAPVLEELRLAAVRGAKINGTFGPGEEAQVTATIQGRMGGLIQAEGTVTCAGKEVLRAMVTLSGNAPQLGSLS